MNYLLLMMGGSGTRLGADRPKQYIEIDGIPIFFYILRSYNQLDCIDEIIIVSNEMWIDYVQKWVDSLELKKQRFNNKFVLYEGENIDIATVTKLLKTAGKNMTDFEVIDGRNIKILIQSGVKNDEKAEQIINALSSQKYTYNIKMEYNEEGYINAIDISVYEKK